MIASLQSYNILPMTIERLTDQPDLGCLADYFSQRVDDALNGGGRQEAIDATDALHAPEDDKLTDQDQSLYIDESVRFEKTTGVCSVCRKDATLSPDGGIEAAYCRSTGSCEIEWAQNHPELYQDSKGNPLNPSVSCRGFQCRATIGWVGVGASMDPATVAGVCTVVTKGKEHEKYKRSRLSKRDIEEHPPEKAYQEAMEVKPIQGFYD